MNPDLEQLLPYPFQRLAALKQGISPAPGHDPVALSIGEPRHPTPGIITEALISHLHGLSHYPLTRGGDGLRESIAAWLRARFALPASTPDPASQVLPVNGTREALFSFAQCIVDRNSDPLVLMPNPFYQIYEGAALLAGATPVFFNTTREHAYLPDFDAVDSNTWERCQLLYICSPGNPTGAVIDTATLQKLIRLAQQHDFVIASDECYSEIYLDENDPPPGLLGAAAAMGHHDFTNCVVFHSLSKRSNAPGLRSGFVAGDAGIIERFLLYRTYHGCAMAPPVQAASRAAWSDEQHVVQNRRLYREKFDAVLDILEPVLETGRPRAGFYLWPKTPIDDTRFAAGLFRDFNVTVLPGSFLSRESAGVNPGAGHVRLALVPEMDECLDAARRIRRYVESL